ncbi:hypothetical protein T10_11896 [Trichinella papuae]|uniref:Uncharacterized protein n=1 Tax=Trichinella papuae TaxID=268474 RepID=A0A0V1N7D9_9BILA|nr:hypothetical protein T10_11896 [Trichinella papuae]
MLTEWYRKIQIKWNLTPYSVLLKHLRAGHCQKLCLVVISRLSFYTENGVEIRKEEKDNNMWETLRKQTKSWKFLDLLSFFL